MLLKSKLLGAGHVATIVTKVSARCYGLNLGCQVRDDGIGRDGVMKVRFTLDVASSFAPGARTSASGRHMPKASWQAHRDVISAIFDADPEAVLQTALATYKGRDDFLARFEATGDTNCGSQMHPVAIRDTAV